MIYILSRAFFISLFQFFYFRELRFVHHISLSPGHVKYSTFRLITFIITVCGYWNIEHIQSVPRICSLSLHFFMIFREQMIVVWWVRVKNVSKQLLASFSFSPWILYIFYSSSPTANQAETARQSFKYYGVLLVLYLISVTTF